jgi:hypothetical protein
MPAKTAKVPRALWYEALTDQLVLLGGSALFAYEADTEILTPAALTDDTVITFLIEDVALEIDHVRGVYEEAGGDFRGEPRQRDDRVLMQAEGAPPLALVTKDWIVDRFADASEDELEVLGESFSLAPFVGVTIARDAKPVEIRAPDPRAYALIAYVLRSYEEIELDRARFAAALVRERWPEQFEPRQEAAFPALCLDEEPDSPRFGPYPSDL